MKTMRYLIMSLVIIYTFLLGPGGLKAADWDKKIDFPPIRVSGIGPAPIAAAELIPGLEPRYYIEFFERHLDRLPAGESSQYPSFKGKPILELNHQFGKKEVFDSRTGRGVGIRMTGFMNFAAQGVYELQALSNDGIILLMGGKLTLNDPEQHSDRLSNVGIVTIDEPGWYPVVIEYFQRKGTAALKLFWKTPGTATMVPVPAQMYAHLP